MTHSISLLNVQMNTLKISSSLFEYKVIFLRRGDTLQVISLVYDMFEKCKLHVSVMEIHS